MSFPTIVVDPPWTQPKLGGYSWRKGRPSGEVRDLVYQQMPLDRIRDIGIADVAADDAHLFLWVTQRWLEFAPGIARAWGFEYSSTLVWSKPPRGWQPGGFFQSTVEFIVYARRGKPEGLVKYVPGQCFTWPRGEHSAKPDAFLDHVEQWCPGPRLEVFARRARLGWSYAGDQSLGTVEVRGVRNAVGELADEAVPANVVA